MPPSITIRPRRLREGQRRRKSQRARNTANPGTPPHRTQLISIRAPQRLPARVTATRSMRRSHRLRLTPNQARASAMPPSITIRPRRLREGQRRRGKQRGSNTANPGTRRRRTQPISIRAPQRLLAQATATRSTLRSRGLQRRRPANRLKLAPNRATPMAPIIITLRPLTLRTDQRRRQNQVPRNTASPGTQPLQTHRTQLKPIRASQRPPAQVTATRSTLRSQALQRRQARNRLKLGANRAMAASITLRLRTLRGQ